MSVLCAQKQRVSVGDSQTTPKRQAWWLDGNANFTRGVSRRDLAARLSALSMIWGQTYVSAVSAQTHSTPNYASSLNPGDGPIHISSLRQLILPMRLFS